MAKAHRVRMIESRIPPGLVFDALALDGALAQQANEVDGEFAHIRATSAFASRTACPLQANWKNSFISGTSGIPDRPAVPAFKHCHTASRSLRGVRRSMSPVRRRHTWRRYRVRMRERATMPPHQLLVEVTDQAGRRITECNIRHLPIQFSTFALTGVACSRMIRFAISPHCTMGSVIA